ncbi:MAG TPA: class I SAM-dependent methyltransferase [Smithella sp.]|nr:class I SAM-dependent methyltransferase [Smithella sp.]HQI72225.1 class I SAM-dependent methyltransferase [Smithella sp.]
MCKKIKMEDTPIKAQSYLMENAEEEKRLEMKTNPDAVREQALWFGIGPGARILDVGCGPGKTTALLHDLAQPHGRAVGVDISESRINYARAFYGKDNGIDFHVRDVRLPMKDLGQFDFIWVRFLLEYYLDDAFEIIKNISANLKPGGYLCLLDLDHNCLSHWEMPPAMESVVIKAMMHAQENFNFDLYAGRKLYAHLYDLDYEDIKLNIMPHHLIYGELQPADEFNWMKKLEIGVEKAPEIFIDYPGGSGQFLEDFKVFFNDPRRFTYSPLILCQGRKPFHGNIKKLRSNI